MSLVVGSKENGADSRAVEQRGPTLDELAARARECLEGKPRRSYVEDAKAFAAIVIDHKAAIDNLSATQKRCTELLEENRYLRDPRFNPMPTPP